MSKEHDRINWSISESALDRVDRKKNIQGTLVLDVDGTLTVPDKKEVIDAEVIDVLADFLSLGGNLIFCTGATLSRIERTVLTPIFSRINSLMSTQAANQLFDSVFVMPENGSALLIKKDTTVVENERSYDWHRIHELYTPDREKLRSVIENDLMPQHQGSFIAGSQVGDSVSRDYILSWKGVSDTLALVEYIEKEIKPNHPEINWEQIQLKAARTTIDFVDIDSGKTISVAWVLKELAGLRGPVIGFGDLGDEFATVVPTINVNKRDPNVFRRRGMPAMELTGKWKLLTKEDFVITGEGMGAKVRNRSSDEEIQVLRDEEGKIIYAQRTDAGYLTPLNSQKGMPVEIKPPTYIKDGQSVEIGDAGKGTAWMVNRLLSIGYFGINK
jgi:hypothetical protein